MRERKGAKTSAQIIRGRARTFYLASLFLPASLRPDVHVVYAFCRVVDDLVDESPRRWNRTDIECELDRWAQSLCTGVAGWCDLAVELARVRQKYCIPSEYLHMVIDGARFDLDLHRIESRAELRTYSALMAGSVGMIMATILGASSPGALRAAKSLGIAMQFTNVLRDVGEDLQRDRVYVPKTDMLASGCSLQTLYAGEITPALRQVMSSLVDEARELYAEGVHGIRYLQPSTRFAVFLAANLYSHILDKIEARDFDVFSERASLGAVEKWALMVPAYVQLRHLSTGY